VHQFRLLSTGGLVPNVPAPCLEILKV
jgi:hypothetical protein